LVPIYKTDEEKKSILDEMHSMKDMLTALGIRVLLDERENVTPGWKFNEWEVKGVPLRIEMGPRDLAKNEVVVARRDGDKIALPLDDLDKEIPFLLTKIEENLLAKAELFLKEHISEADSVEGMVKILDEKGGYVKAPWGGSAEDEKRLQEQTKATIRLMIEEKSDKKLKCIMTGKETDQLVYFARAY
jgi:prolyl-tRNA synthetase